MELYSENINEEQFIIKEPIGQNKFIDEIIDIINKKEKRIIIQGNTGTGKTFISYYILKKLNYDIKYIHCPSELRNIKNVIEYFKKLKCSYNVNDLFNGIKRKFAIILDNIGDIEPLQRKELTENIPKNLICILTGNSFDNKYLKNFNNIFKIPELHKNYKIKIIEEILKEDIQYIMKKKIDEIIINDDINEIIKYCSFIKNTINKNDKITNIKKSNNIDITKDFECIDFDLKNKIKILLEKKLNITEFSNIFNSDSYVFQNLLIQNLNNILKNEKDINIYKKIFENIIFCNKFNNYQQEFLDINYTSVISYYPLNGLYKNINIEYNNKINNILATRSNQTNILKNLKHIILDEDILKYNSAIILEYIIENINNISKEELKILYPIIYFDTQENNEYKNILKKFK